MPLSYSLIEALVHASPVIFKALIDVVTGLLLAADQLNFHARVVFKGVDVEPQVAGLDGHGQVHDGGGGAVEDAELDGATVDVAELTHLVRQVVGVHQSDGRGVSKDAVATAHTL